MTWEFPKTCFGDGNVNAENLAIPGQGNRQPGNELEEKIRKLEEELYTVKMERDILNCWLGDV